VEKRLDGLQLPSTFASSPLDLSTEDYEVVRQWTTAQDPAATCVSLQQTVSVWFGAAVQRSDGIGCHLYAVDGTDSLSVSLLRLDPTSVRTTLTVRLGYAA